jgi:hypothetical protein
MNTQTFPRTLVRVLVLAIVIAIVYALDFVAFKWNASLETFAWALLVGILQAAVIGYVLVRAVWHGWKLIVALFVVYAGITVFQTQIEAIVFLQYFVNIIPVDAMPALIINGVMAAAIIALAAVFIFDKFKPPAEIETASEPLHLSVVQWIWKVGALAALYVVVYFLFGFVAVILGGEAFQAYYGNLQLPVWFFPFQILRGAVWVLLTIPLICMMRGSWREIGLGVALMLSVLIASLVIPPNEFMPEPVRFAHFVELLTSMFVFGWIDYWLLTWRRQPKTQSTVSGASRAA